MYQTERILRRFGYRCLLGIDFTEEIMEIRLLPKRIDVKYLYTE